MMMIDWQILYSRININVIQKLQQYRELYLSRKNGGEAAGSNGQEAIIHY